MFNATDMMTLPARGNNLKKTARGFNFFYSLSENLVWKKKKTLSSLNFPSSCRNNGHTDFMLLNQNTEMKF